MAEKLTTQSIQGWLQGHAGWTRKSNPLIKEFKFNSFRNSIVFVNRIAGLADDADHHPEILIRHTKVLITLSTHSVGGITQKDLKLAGQLDFATSAG